MRITLFGKAGTLGVVGESNWTTADWSLHGDGERTINVYLGLTGLPGQAHYESLPVAELVMTPEEANHFHDKLRQIMGRLEDELNKEGRG